MIKRRFQIQGMHCTGCAMTVDGALEDMSAVKSAATDYARQTVDVEYDETHVTEAQILAAIQEVGYTASPWLPIPGEYLVRNNNQPTFQISRYKWENRLFKV